MDISFGFGAAGLFLAIAWYSVRKIEHSVDPADRLRTLVELKEAGLIDEKEYEKLRNRQISRLRWND